jgi:4-oxalocrotonate tautomerase
MPLVQVTMIEGKTAEQKRALQRKVTDAVVDALGAPEPSVRVVIYEVPAAHWAVGGEPKG